MKKPLLQLWLLITLTVSIWSVEPLTNMSLDNTNYPRMNPSYSSSSSASSSSAATVLQVSQPDESVLSAGDVWQEYVVYNACDTAGQGTITLYNSTTGTYSALSSAYDCSVEPRMADGKIAYENASGAIAVYDVRSAAFMVNVMQNLQQYSPTESIDINAQYLTWFDALSHTLYRYRFDDGSVKNYSGISGVNQTLYGHDLFYDHTFNPTDHDIYSFDLQNEYDSAIDTTTEDALHPVANSAYVMYEVNDTLTGNFNFVLYDRTSQSMRRINTGTVFSPDYGRLADMSETALFFSEITQPSQMWSMYRYDFDSGLTETIQTEGAPAGTYLRADADSLIWVGNDGYRWRLYLKQFAEPNARVRDFIRRFYRDILGREADASGLSFWTNTIQHNSAAAVALGFFDSAEFKAMVLDNVQYMDILYNTMYGRPADESGMQYWLGKLQNGTSRRNVLYSFLNAPEFKTLADSFGVTAIRDVDQPKPTYTTGVEGLISRFYTLVLGRNVEQSGLDYWTQKIMTGQQSVTEVAHGFFDSNEYRNKQQTDDAFLQTVYAVFFGREPDESGRLYWKDRMLHGSSRWTVVDEFAASQEFANIVAGFSDDYSGGSPLVL